MQFADINESEASSLVQARCREALPVDTHRDDRGDPAQLPPAQLGQPPADRHQDIRPADQCGFQPGSIGPAKPVWHQPGFVVAVFVDEQASPPKPPQQPGDKRAPRAHPDRHVVVAIAIPQRDQHKAGQKKNVAHNAEQGR